ncbi:MAG: diadenylate cyclase CdaA [Clostridioides sp.]|nr:diadenylate cyclase CdaA [Clostridioides sp.]
MRVGFTDILDIAIVSYIIYKVYMFIKDTRAQQVFKGIIILIIVIQLSDVLNLHTFSWLLKNSIEFSIIAVIILQPEIRSALERIGRTRLSFFGKYLTSEEEESRKHMIEEIIESLYSLSRQKIGALIIMERETKLNEIVNTGTILDSEVSRQLLINIFIPNTPLHDGAVIVRDTKIKAAACFLPLTESKDLSKDLGTRHRAGIGVSEVSDCITLIVSEETGEVSIAKMGKLYRNISKERLTNILNSNMSLNSNGKSFIKGGLFK